ncbi:MAG: hypothetical protein ACUZ8I_07665 [Candidatus Scalindua sp.]
MMNLFRRTNGFVIALGEYVPKKSSKELINEIKLNTKMTFLGEQIVFDDKKWHMVFLKKFHENLTREFI